MTTKNIGQNSIAIIGVACRFPQAKNIQEFWHLIKNKRDGISEVPKDRWDIDALYDPTPGTSGKMYTKWGGFIEDIDLFDAKFFKIAPREAIHMDPQQRILLETTWNAFEDAGIAAVNRYKKQTGVFVGISGWDYGRLQTRNLGYINHYMGIGSALSIAANRISYSFDLQGPSLAIDTACSSSLVAVHLACENIRSGACKVAVAGGVNLIITPETTLNFCQANALAKDGRCKTFDNSADGYTRSEGVGVVILKSLKEAIEDNDNIYAVVTGSAINNDGLTNGIMAPNRLSQENVIKQAHQNANVVAADIEYIEAHGTGTLLGDPIEVQALNNVLAENRTIKCRVGSVKSNIGHLESAAGIAGVIKTALMIKSKEIPASIHFNKPNEYIEWDKICLQVQQETESWDSERCLTGLSSFSFGGTNVHAILQRYESNKKIEKRAIRNHILRLSAHTKEALQQMAEEYCVALYSKPNERIGDICFSANVGRGHFAHRLTIIGNSVTEICDQLTHSLDEHICGKSSRKQPKIVWLFTGQGSQYSSMAKTLYDTEPYFRKNMDLCQEILQSDISLLDVIFSHEHKERLNTTEYTQPALFAVEYSLAQLWIKWGVVPDIVMGHSVGEYVAACIAGIMDVADALSLLSKRACLMQSLPKGGGMLAVFAPYETVVTQIGTLDVDIAAINAPQQTVVAGSLDQISILSAKLENENIHCKQLNVSHAFHSHLMEPIIEEFRSHCANVSLNVPKIQFISNLTGKEEKHLVASPDYWVRHIREPVKFLDSIETIGTEKSIFFMEIGPSPFLTSLVKRTIKNKNVSFHACLKQGEDDWQEILTTLGNLYVKGIKISWEQVYPSDLYNWTKLPLYPFQRERFWIDMEKVKESVSFVAPNTKGLFYETTWLHAENPKKELDKTLQSTHLLVFCNNVEYAKECLSHFDGKHSIILPGKSYGNIESNIYTIAANSSQDYEILLRDITHQTKYSVLYLWPLAKEETAVSSYYKNTQHLFYLLQAMNKNRHFPKRTWIVTRGAKYVEDNVEISPGQAALWSMVQVATLENPKMHISMMDLDTSIDKNETKIIAEEMIFYDGEKHLVIRNHERYVARLVKTETSDDKNTLDLEGCYLITGGLGGLGLKIASWMVQKGVQNILLTSRRPPSELTTEMLKTLAKGRASISVLVGNVADTKNCEEIFSNIRKLSTPLKGVIHAAGMINDNFILQQQWKNFESVSRAKVEGAWNLHKQTQNLDLDFFILCSSMSSLLGSVGQINYAAANGFMDALACYREAKSLPCLSIQWGPWSHIGMAADLEEKYLQSAPELRYLSPDLGIQALDDVRSMNGNIAVLDIDWSKLGNRFRETNIKFLHVLLPDSIETETRQHSDLIFVLNETPRRQREHVLVEHMRNEIAKIMGLKSKEGISADEGLFEMGMDSLMAVELQGKLEATFGQSFSSTLAFDYSTISDMARYILKEHFSEETAKETTRIEVKNLEQEQDNAIAVIGMGCRFPGSDTPEEFWEILKEGKEIRSEVPKDRWSIDDYYDESPQASDKMYTRHGSFLDSIDMFDPEFFGIAPREVITMDPQQRLLLEVTWEALENAGYSPKDLTNSTTGVYVGIGSSDYFQQIMNIVEVDPYVGTGLAFCVASGRISYLLGLQGPSIALDTACSSSLVTVHLACQSLRLRESNMAVAGGVNLIIAPHTSIYLSKVKALSPDGRCKTFDDSANGYMRGEGCGMVVLKRLSDALRDKDNVLAVIRGSAVNHDGPSSGLTVPNGIAQQNLIKEALRNGKVNPKDVSYVEAHGTGTPLGDPIEIKALASVLGKNRSPEDPVAVGSVKTNIGHLENAAGIAGLMKVVLSIHNKKIPAHLHFKTPNSRIPWDAIPIHIPTQLSAWPKKQQIAAVSSFGLSGTNAHLIVESSQNAVVNIDQYVRPLHILPLSAKTSNSLETSVDQYISYLEKSEETIENICFTASVGRSHFEQRLAVVASDRGQLLKKLRLEREQYTAKDFSETNTMPKKIVFLFTGQGSQYTSMGKELYRTNAQFKKTLDECSNILEEFLDKSLLEILFQPENEEYLNQTMYTQPALFSLEYSLAKLWESWGIRPYAVMGHSVGEYVAACLAGVFTLEEGLQLIAARGKLMQQLPQTGIMLAVRADKSDIWDEIKENLDKIDIAATNGPKNLVLSGDKETLRELVTILDAKEIKSQYLVDSHAFQSPLMEPMIENFREHASKISYKAPEISIISNLTGKEVGKDEITNADYWCQHIRNAVQFWDSIKTLDSSNFEVFLEIGPNATLLAMGRGCVPNNKGLWLPSLRKGKKDWEQMLQSLRELYVYGVDIDWHGFERGYEDRKRIPLPTYCFDRKRHWIDEKASLPFMQNVVFEATLDLKTQSMIKDHQLYGLTIYPGAAYLEDVLAAAMKVFGHGMHELYDVAIYEPLIMEMNKVYYTQIVISKLSSQEASFLFCSVEDRRNIDSVKQHVSGKIKIVSSISHTADTEDISKIQARCIQSIDTQVCYQELHNLGLQYGPDFQSITKLYYNENEVLSHLRLPDNLIPQIQNHHIHPSLLDGGFQSFSACLMGTDFDENHIYVPIGLERFSLYSYGTSNLWCHVLPRNVRENAESFSGDIKFYNEDGQCVGEIINFQFRRTNRNILQQSQAKIQQYLYGIQWQSLEEGTSTTHSDVLTNTMIVTNDIDWGRKVAGNACYFVGLEQEERSLSEKHIYIPGNEEDWEWAWENTSLEKSCRIVYFYSEKEATHYQDCIQLLSLLKFLHQKNKRCELMFVTVGAQAVNADGVENLNISSSTLLGMSKVIALEYPNVKCLCLDLEKDYSIEEQVKIIYRELHTPRKESEIAVRNNATYAPRLQPYNKLIAKKNRLALPPSESYRLHIEKRGALHNLEFIEANRPQVQDNFIEIEVCATGLNFRDVMSVLGMYPGDPGLLGAECSGKVVKIGKNVTRFKEGDEILAITSGCFSKYTNIHHDLAVKKPQNMTFEGAATIPITFLTVYYGFYHLAKMKKGDKVLIHSAAGGVGLAAIQIAQHIGAEIYATAGSTQKREYLRSLGVKHIMNSRSFDFASEIREMTKDGSGINVVLNSLAGDYIPKSLELMADGGTFLEIGKVDIWTQDKVNEVHSKVNYIAFDLGDVCRDEPEFLQDMFSELMSLFAANFLQPLHHKIFEYQEAVLAFRYMAQAKHMGKIVLSQNYNVIRSDGTYLISGGLGALGFEIVKTMAEKGATNFVLLGRSSPRPEIVKQIGVLSQNGIRIVNEQVDISDADALSKVFTKTIAQMPPLRGIVHAAGVLDDGIIAQQTEERFEKVMAPKVIGAWNLHNETLNIPLDFTVFFSSLASLIGSPGQSSYAAANAFLDNLAYYRSHNNMPTLSINWGPWADIGMAAASKQNSQLWGLDAISSEQGSRIFLELLNTIESQVAVLPVNWTKFLPLFSAQMPSLLSSVEEELNRKFSVAADEPKKKTPSILKKLENLPKKRAREVLVTHIKDQAIQILGLDPSFSLNIHQPIQELGLDSLMALELKNTLSSSLGKDLPVTLLFDYPTISTIVDYLGQDILKWEEEVPEKEVKEITPNKELEEELEDVSQEELDKLIEEELKEIGDLIEDDENE